MLFNMHCLFYFIIFLQYAICPLDGSETHVEVTAWPTFMMQRAILSLPLKLDTVVVGGPSFSFDIEISLNTEANVMYLLCIRHLNKEIDTMHVILSLP